MSIKGLYYINNIKDDNINKLDIILELDKFKWDFLSTSKNSRKVQHYGYKYNYTTYNIYEKTTEFPDIINIYKNYLTNKCIELNIINQNNYFNQCIVNNYEPGQGISSHIDLDKYGDVIGCFTIGSGAMMTFRTDEYDIHDLYVEPNSLYIMSDEARYKWKHEMKGRKTDIVNNNKIKRDRRISITFRNVPI